MGSAICRGLREQNYENFLQPSHKELDLENGQDTADFFQQHKPEFVFLAAAKVGGIKANETYPAEFIYRNLMIEMNVIHAAWKSNVKRLLFLGSSCIYPKYADQPMREEALLEGKLEPTNEPYAIAKIAGIKLCESYNRQYETDFRCLMPCNLYGQGDNFHLTNSHVIPAMMRKFHEAKLANQATVKLWGSGNVYREFLHVDDLASATVFVMNLSKQRLDEAVTPMTSHLNVGMGEDLSIKQLAETIKAIVGYSGDIVWDTSMPDGPPRKIMNIDKLTQLGWQPKIGLEAGLALTYAWYREKGLSLRK